MGLPERNELGLKQRGDYWIRIGKEQGYKTAVIERNIKWFWNWS
jgi:hypothetical protein